MQVVVGKQYELLRRVTGGSFGEIYHALNRSNQQIVAVKLEPLKSKHHQLEYEAKLLAYLNEGVTPAEIGLPRLYYFGKNEEYNIMVMDLLGPSL
jgi:casein kinase I homolog HRR25